MWNFCQTLENAEYKPWFRYSETLKRSRSAVTTQNIKKGFYIALMNYTKEVYREEMPYTKIPIAKP